MTMPVAPSMFSATMLGWPGRNLANVARHQTQLEVVLSAGAHPDKGVNGLALVKIFDGLGPELRMPKEKPQHGPSMGRHRFTDHQAVSSRAR